MIEMPQFGCPVELKTPTQSYAFPLTATSEPTHFGSSGGLVYQITAIREAILNGELEVNQMKHADSLLVAEILDEFLRQLGVTYH